MFVNNKVLLKGFSEIVLAFYQKGDIEPRYPELAYVLHLSEHTNTAPRPHIVSAESGGGVEVALSALLRYNDQKVETHSHSDRNILK